MDPLRNPFSPGAGAAPPELAGRDDVIQDAEIAVARVIRGRSAQSQILLGLRGTGKTVLLNQIEQIAESHRFYTSFIEAPEDKQFLAKLSTQMRQTLRKLSAIENARYAAIEALKALRNFAAMFKLNYEGFDIGMEPTPGAADSGHLDSDLTETFELIGKAAKAADRGWAVLIDEVQYLSKEELSALIVAVHRINQKGLPIIVFAAGLPQIAKLTGDSKSYSERLFRFPSIGALDDMAASAAIRNPIEKEGESISDEALSAVVEKTGGYPFFLQEWGYQAWEHSSSSPIDRENIEIASKYALERLDGSFFRVRMDRLTNAEIEYVDAMADLGAGPYKSNQVAAKLARTPQSLGPCRSSLIRKGMIFSPTFGEIDFTVPLFDDFLRRRSGI